MLTIAIDGTAHSGKRLFAVRLGWLLGDEMRWSAENATRLLYEAAFAKHPEAHPYDVAWAARHDSDLRKAVFAEIEADRLADGTLVVSGPGVYDADGWPDADVKAFCCTPAAVAQTRAQIEGVQGDSWWQALWGAAAYGQTAAEEDDENMGLDAYIAWRNAAEHGFAVDHSLPVDELGDDVDCELIERLAAHDDDPGAPARLGLSTAAFIGSDVMHAREDLLAVDWLRRIRPLLEAAGVRSVDPDLLPDYRTDEPSVVAAAEAAARMVDALRADG